MRILLSAFLLCAAFVPAAADGALPDTPMGRLATAWLEAFNSGNEATMRAFNEAHLRAPDLAKWSMEDRLGAFRRMHRQIGVLRPLEVAGARAAELVLVVESATGERLRITVSGDAGDAEHLTGVMIEPIEDDDPAAAATGPPITESAMRDSIDAWIDRNVAADLFSGVARVVDGDRTVYERAAGLAERRFDVPNTMETRFNIGSITKLFTKVAIAKLMSEGKIAPGDRLSKHLPGYRKDVADRITIGQLLEHESGLGDIFGPEYDAMEKSNLRELKDFLPLFEDKPLRFEPGSDRYYSNAGYTVLGLVIERLSGMPYHEYIRKVVYEPAGMTASGPGDSDRPIPLLATGYTRAPRQRDWSAMEHDHGHGADGSADRTWELRANTYHLPGLSSSAGGGYSSATDLERFARAFRHDRLLPPAYTRWVLGGDVPAPGQKGGKPSMGSFPPGAAIGVGGGAEGLNAVLEMSLDRDLTVVVMANMDPPIAEDLGRKIRGWMRRAGLTGASPGPKHTTPRPGGH